MQLAKFLKELDQLCSGQCDEEQSVKHRGTVVRLDYSAPQLLLTVRQPARHKLLISQESPYTRRQDELGVAQEAKLGRPEFDDRYVLRNADDSTAAELLTDDVVGRLEGLQPFQELELSATGYRLLKHFEQLEDYSPKAALADIERFLDIIEHTRKEQQPVGVD